MLYCPRCGTPIGSTAIRGEVRPRQPRTPANVLTYTLIAVAVVMAIIIFASTVPNVLLPRMLVGSGHFVTTQESFTGFNAVEVSSGFQYTIIQSNSYSINVTIDDNLVGYVQVSQSGGTLSVGLTQGYGYISATPKVVIGMPDISRLDLSGGSSGTVAGFVLSHDFTTALSGGSRVSMTGRGDSLSVEASGGSRLDMSNFVVANAHVDLSGGSQTTVNVSGRLDADLSGGSQLYYLGNPTLGTISSSGGSIVSKR